jgi:hypothetical protein
MAPTTQCNDVARIGQIRRFAGSINFGSTPSGVHGQPARAADHPETDERKVIHELERSED